MTSRFSTYRPRKSSPLTRSPAAASKNPQWGIATAEVRNDLTAGKGRPLWILSTYGPGRSPPASLFEGNEYSFEELRIRFYELNAAGKQEQANQEAGGLWSKAEQAMADVANNADKVINFMEEAEKKHPTRQDLCRMDGTRSRDQVIREAGSSNSLGSTTPAFGQTSFGQPGSTNSAFGRPATSFGQPTAPGGFGTSGFGQPAQPSAFGQPSTSTFGKPSTGFGQPGLGQPSQPTPAFGQPSQPTPAFGQPAQPSGFGQPSALGAKSPFGVQPTSSPFGQQPQTTSSFGQPAQTSTAFGQPSKPSSGFGQPSQPSGFGQISQPTPAFGQPSRPTPAFGQASQPSSGFGQSAQPAPGFGQTSQRSGFAQPSTAPPPFGQVTTSAGFGSPPAPSFGGPSAPTGVFGQPATPHPRNPFAQSPSTSTPFGQPSQLALTTTPFGKPPTTSAPNENPFAKPPSSAPNGFSASAPTALPPNTNSSAKPHPLTNKPPRPLHYTQTIPGNAPTVTNPQTKKLQTYRGRQVKYINEKPCYQRPDGNDWEQVWFPQDAATPEVVALGKEDKVIDLVADQDRYTDEVREQFAYLFEMGTFQDGKMPVVPPLREWCVYDF